MRRQRPNFFFLFFFLFLKFQIYKLLHGIGIRRSFFSLSCWNFSFTLQLRGYIKWFGVRTVRLHGFAIINISGLHQMLYVIYLHYSKHIFHSTFICFVFEFHSIRSIFVCPGLSISVQMEKKKWNAYTTFTFLFACTVHADKTRR